MKLSLIKEKIGKLIVFQLQDLYFADPSFRQGTLYDWVKQGQVIRLKKNCYIFSDFKVWGYDLYLLSNRIYQPSYISLELALSHYGVIPESVHLITAVSTLKTQKFVNTCGTFQYNTIAKDLFFGYHNLPHRERTVQIATIEKTILDYLYLNSPISNLDDFIGLRWNQQILNEIINWNKLKSYLVIYNNEALRNRVSILKKYLEE